MIEEQVENVNSVRKYGEARGTTESEQGTGSGKRDANARRLPLHVLNYFETSFDSA